EFRVLDYLANRDDPIRETSLRSATRVSRAVLNGMVRKKWIEREDVSGARDAARVVRVAVLSAESEEKTLAPARRAKLNANQQSLLDVLADAGGRAEVDTLHSLDVPRSTLSTLVKRGLVEIVEEPAEFHVSRM